MDEQRKRAYRYLLYNAMLEIRPIAWMPFGFFRCLNPFYWRSTSQRILRAGVIADWLHNLAHFSALDFERFDEEWFWREYSAFEGKYPAFRLSKYKDLFERILSESSHVTTDWHKNCNQRR
jgi:hypothetical protein